MGTCYKFNAKPDIFSHLQEITNSSDISKAVFTFERGYIPTADVTFQFMGNDEVENLVKKFDLVERGNATPLNSNSPKPTLLGSKAVSRIAKVQLICGDAQTIQQRINELLPEWQMDGGLVWDGRIFWQKMVKCS